MVGKNCCDSPDLNSNLVDNILTHVRTLPILRSNKKCLADDNSCPRWTKTRRFDNAGRMLYVRRVTCFTYESNHNIDVTP